MNINDYVEKLQNDVLQFRQYWRKMQEEHPENFPDELPPEEWHEQFLTFVETR